MIQSRTWFFFDASGPDQSWNRKVIGLKLQLATARLYGQAEAVKARERG